MIFVLRLFRMVANQTDCSKLEQRLLRSVNHVKFIKECDVNLKACFGQQTFINGLNCLNKVTQ